jgi:DNA-binding protein
MGRGMNKVIIRAYGLTIDKAVEIVGRVGVGNILKDQIDDDDFIVATDDCAIHLTTKNRRSIVIDVVKPKITSIFKPR